MLVDQVLSALNWKFDDLDIGIQPAKAYAGAWHLVLAAKTKLDELYYDFDQLKSVMPDNNLTTIQLLWQESENVFHSRNPFPVEGVVEDPATGAAAAALGENLRDSGYFTAPKMLTIRQGDVMGRPSQITVNIPE